MYLLVLVFFISFCTVDLNFLKLTITAFYNLPNYCRISWFPIVSSVEDGYTTLVLGFLIFLVVNSGFPAVINLPSRILSFFPFFFFIQVFFFFQALFFARSP